MAFPAHDAVELLALLAVGVALLGVAPLLRVPYPILLVLGGVAVGFLPGLPHIQLRPEVVLVAVLPPLLYAAAFFTSLRDLRANARPLSLLAVGLVLVTMVVVAVACHEAISGLSWPISFVIGAVVAPTDAVAATAIASRLGVPRRLVAIIEGESLINDATALVAYSFAVTAVTTGSFSLWHAAWRFVLDVVGGVAIGLAVGFVLRQIRRRLDHSPTEIAIALLSGYFAYLPAEAAGVSAVLAVGYRRGIRRLVHARAHDRADAPAGRRRLGDPRLPPQCAHLRARRHAAAADSRLALRPVDDDAARGRSDRGRRGRRHAARVDLSGDVRASVSLPAHPGGEPYPPWQYPTVIGWAGLRGAVCLAAALALPLTVDSGAAFPERT